MTEIHWNFTEKCLTCGATVRYTAGQREPHPCPENPALVIEGCNAGMDLAERVDLALADYEALSGNDPT